MDIHCYSFPLRTAFIESHTLWYVVLSLLFSCRSCLVCSLSWAQLGTALESATTLNCELKCALSNMVPSWSLFHAGWLSPQCSPPGSSVLHVCCSSLLLHLSMEDSGVSSSHCMSTGLNCSSCTVSCISEKGRHHLPLLCWSFSLYSFCGCQCALQIFPGSKRPTSFRLVFLMWLYSCVLLAHSERLFLCCLALFYLGAYNTHYFLIPNFL